MDRDEPNSGDSLFAPGPPSPQKGPRTALALPVAQRDPEGGRRQGGLQQHQLPGRLPPPRTDDCCCWCKAIHPCLLQSTSPTAPARATRSSPQQPRPAGFFPSLYPAAPATTARGPPQPPALDSSVAPASCLAQRGGLLVYKALPIWGGSEA